MIKKFLFIFLFFLLWIKVAKAENLEVLAEVGRYKLYKEEVESIIQKDPQIKEILAQYPEARGQVYNAIVERWLMFSILSLAAKDEGFDKLPEIQKELDELTRNFLAKKYLEAKLKKIEITEPEVREYYEKNKTKYVIPEGVELKHILIYVSNKASKEEEEKALNKAQQIRAQILKGAKFEEMAKKYSDDKASKDKGGALGIIRRGETDPEFESQVFKLKPGEISPPIRSTFGYHLVKLERKEPQKQMSFEEAREMAKKDLKEEKEEVYIKSLLEELNKKYNPRLYLR